MAEEGAVSSEEPASFDVEHLAAGMTPHDQPLRDNTTNETVRSLAYQYSGPIPSPEDLAGYEAVSPGAAKIILDMAQSSLQSQIQSDRETTALQHRALELDRQRLDLKAENIKLDRTEMVGNIVSTVIGQCAAFSVAMSFLAASVYLIIQGHPYEGGVLGGGELVALVTAFIYKPKERRREPISSADQK